MLTKMTIGQKLTMAFTTLALLMLGFAWFATLQLSNIYRDASEVSDNIVPSIRASSQMHVSLLDARRAELNMVIDVLGKDPDSLNSSTQSFEAAKSQYMAAEQRYGSMPFVSERDRNMFAELKTAAAKYFSAHGDLETAIRQGDIAKVQSLIKNESRAASSRQGRMVWSFARRTIGSPTC